MAGQISERELEDRLQVEFIDDVRDRLERLNTLLNDVADGKRTDAEALAVLRREAHNLAGVGGAFGYHAISLVAHRMSDYFTGVERLELRPREDAQVFVDRLSALVDRVEQPDLAETNRLLRALPTRFVFDVTDVEVKDVEVMLVTPTKVIARKVSAELAACGFRSITVRDPIEAISLAVRIPPDMLMASLVMDGLSGLDLIRGLKAISVTRNVPMALLTSVPANSAVLKEIPPGVGVVHTGPRFSEDFAEVITKFNLG